MRRERAGDKMAGMTGRSETRRRAEKERETRETAGRLACFVGGGFAFGDDRLTAVRRKSGDLLLLGVGYALRRGLPDGGKAQTHGLLSGAERLSPGACRQGFAGSALHPQGTSSLDPLQNPGTEAVLFATAENTKNRRANGSGKRGKRRKKREK